MKSILTECAVPATHLLGSNSYICYICGVVKSQTAVRYVIKFFLLSIAVC